MDRKLVFKNGKKYYELDETQRSESFGMEVLTSEDAQLQARIWNRFIKKRPLDVDEGEYFITPTVFNDLLPREESSSNVLAESSMSAMSSNAEAI
jgi:hypothetical protein